MTKKTVRRLLASAEASAVVAVVVYAWSSGGKRGANAKRVVRDVPHLEGGSIVYSSGFRERAGIQFAEVVRAPLTPTFRLVGTVTFDPAHVAAIGTRVRGFVRSASKYEGDDVTPGEALAAIESAEVGQAQADISVARAQAEAAAINARRERELLARNLTTAREAEIADATLASQRAALEAAQQRARALAGTGGAPFGLFVLRSPLGGTVVERHLAPGQSVEGNMLAYKVADLSHLWIELSVPEQNVASVHLGDRVEVTPVSDGKAAIVGTVAHVGEVIDLSSRSADVRITVDNAKRLLRPGQSVFATVMASSRAHESLVIPQSAIAYIDGRATVFVEVGEGRVNPAPVTLGAEDATHAEVLSGLSEGQRVASAGVFPLKSELFR